MSRCEDFPCCGHAGDLDGCPDMDRVNECKDCGERFHPDNRCEKYCSRCVALSEIKNGYFNRMICLECRKIAGLPEPPEEK